MSNYFSFNNSDINMHYSIDLHPKSKNFFMHTHNVFEIYCFFEGKGTFKIEGNEYPLNPGDILIMNIAEAHYIEINENYSYRRFSINFSPSIFESINCNDELLLPFTNREFGQLNRYKGTDFENETYKICISNLTDNCNNKRLEIISNLLLLLNEINKAFKNKNKNIPEDLIPYKIVSFVNSNVTKPITLDLICSMFFISKPQLCRIFKSATGSTVWEYITIKRLIIAKELLSSGIAPTRVCTQCGFNDYSVFYRAYKKKYNCSPSNIK